MFTKLIYQARLLMLLLGTVLLLATTACGNAAALNSSPNTGGSYNAAPRTAATATAPLSSKGQLTIRMLDLQHGDGILLQAEGKNVLIDCGDIAHRPQLIARLKQLGLPRIDAFILTHPHVDHTGGFQAVLKSFAVGTIYDTFVENSQSKFSVNLIREYNSGRLNAKRMRSGSKIQLTPGFYFEVLAPGEQLLPNKLGYNHYINNSSMVLKLHYGNFTMLFTGDAEFASENDLVSRYGNGLKADILKVGHHGSRTSSGWPFLKAVNPAWALISCGQPEKYHHPHKEVLGRLGAQGIKVLTTLNNGELVVTSDGKGYQVHGSK